MPSTRPGVARPVRMWLNSWTTWATAFSILSSVSRRMSSYKGALLRGCAPRGGGRRSLPDPRADGSARGGPGEVPRGRESEHDDGQAVLAAEGERGEVHHAEAPLEALLEGEPLVALRRRVGLRVPVV